MGDLYWVASDLGHLPLAWSPPDGYPDEAVAWQSAGGTLGRWNTHLSLAAHWWPDALRQPPLRKLLPDRLPRTHGDYVDALAQRLVFRKLTQRAQAGRPWFPRQASGRPTVSRRRSGRLAAALHRRSHPRLALSRNPVTP